MLDSLKSILGFGPKADLGELLAQKATVLDVRTRGEYNSGHMKGSVNIPLDQLRSNLGKLKGKDHPIITCCASGMRSASAKSILAGAGFTNVHNGGSWQSVQRHAK